MLRVSVYSWKGAMKLEKVGEIAWDGEKITGRGAFDARTITDEPVVLRGRRLVWAADEPSSSCARSGCTTSRLIP